MAERRDVNPVPVPGVEGSDQLVHAVCAGHPFAPPGGCGWTGTVGATAERDPTCPRCGGWVERIGQIEL